MNTVIFNTENTIFTFSKKEVKEHLIFKQTEYALGEVTQLLEFFSTDASETILNSDDYHYFGYVALDLTSTGMGSVNCKICSKIYDAGQLKEFAIGYGKSPFAFNQIQEGGFNLFKKTKNPSIFGGHGFLCPEGHTLISMETWRT